MEVKGWGTGPVRAKVDESERLRARLARAFSIKVKCQALIKVKGWGPIGGQAGQGQARPGKDHTFADSAQRNLARNIPL